MPPIIECARVSKAFVMRENRQYLLKDRALAMLRPHLREHRQTFWALRDVDFAVERGEAFGVIGPSGAGKTTRFRIISGIFTPAGGAGGGYRPGTNQRGPSNCHCSAPGFATTKFFSPSAFV